RREQFAVEANGFLSLRYADLYSATAPTDRYPDELVRATPARTRGLLSRSSRSDGRRLPARIAVTCDLAANGAHAEPSPDAHPWKPAAYGGRLGCSAR